MFRMLFVSLLLYIYIYIYIYCVLLIILLCLFYRFVIIFGNFVHVLFDVFFLFFFQILICFVSVSCVRPCLHCMALLATAESWREV